MTPDPVCVDEDASLDDVIIAMDSRKVAQIPVVSAGKVIGMISRFELISALEASLSQGERGAEAAE
jgi:CBS domain-containing protein